MVAGLGGANRDPERRRDVGERHPEVVVHDDDRALLGLEPLEGFIEQVAVSNDVRDVADDRCIHRQQLDLHRPASPPADHVDAGSEDQAVQPRLEAIGIAQAGQTAPGGKEPFLDRVSRELVVPEDQTGRRVQPRDERAGKRGKGVMIASPRPLDELSLVHDHPL